MNLNDAEIFQTGSWPGSGAAGITFTEADLDGIVSSFEALGLAGCIPIKVGHQGKDIRDDDTAPALGWVQSVRREGTKLLADIKFTSGKLIEGIRSGAYKFVSAELLHNVKAHTRLIPWVLDAVALLGATAPAVGTLRDLQASMQSFSRRTGLRFSGERLAFKREDVNPPLGESNDMDAAEVQAAIAKAVKDASAELTTKFSAEIGGLKTELSTAKVETDKAKAQAHRVSVLAPFEAAIKDGRINAACRDQFSTTFAVADDRAVLTLSPKLAEDFIEGSKDQPKFKGPGANTRKARQDDNDETRFTDKSNAEVLTLKTHDRVLKTNGKITCFADLETASKFVLQTDKDLARSYFDDPQAEYQPPASKKDAA